MKTLIVYYSLEGNTAYAAGNIAESISSAGGQADTLRLVPVKAYADKGFAKFFWGGKSAVMAEKPALEPYDADIRSYDRIIFGFPVWASCFAPPLRTFITENADALKEKDIAAFACQAGNGAEKALGKLSTLVGKGFSATAVFIDPLKNKEDADRVTESFCRSLNER